MFCQDISKSQLALFMNYCTCNIQFNYFLTIGSK